jgi:hypothetical protein
MFKKKKGMQQCWASITNTPWHPGMIPLWYITLSDAMIENYDIGFHTSKN